MKKRYFAYATVGLLGVGAVALALAAVNRLPEPPGPVGETPELGRVGDYAIGTVEKDYTFPNRTGIARWSGTRQFGGRERNFRGLK